MPTEFCVCIRSSRSFCSSRSSQHAGLLRVINTHRSYRLSCSLVLLVLFGSACNDPRKVPIATTCATEVDCSSGYTCLADHRCVRLILPSCARTSATACAALSPGQSCAYNYAAVTPCQAESTDCNGGCAVCDCPKENPNDPNSPPQSDCKGSDLVWGACKVSLCALGQVHSCSACDDDCARSLNIESTPSGTSPNAQCTATKPASMGVVPIYKCAATAAAQCQAGYVDADNDLASASNNGCECVTDAGACSATGNTACDHAIDEAVVVGEAASAPVGCVEYYYDGDGDGHGDPHQTLCLCGPMQLYTATVGDDCNDANAQIYPGAPELCDEIDNNCNGQIDEGRDNPGCRNYYADRDGDGFGGGTPMCLCLPNANYFMIDHTDCDDDPQACGAACHPGLDEVYDNYDNDCNGHVNVMVNHVAGPLGGSGSADGVGSEARFSSPYGLTRDGDNLYVAEYGNFTIRKVVISTGEVTTLAGSARRLGSTDGRGAAARFQYPYDVINDGTNLYVADAINRTIRKVVIATGDVTTLAGLAGSTGSTDATGAAARFNFPTALASDGTNLYVTDTYNYTIRKIVITTGEVSTFVGETGTLGSANGIGTAARFYNPYGIACDGANLYVVDTTNRTIRKVVIATREVTTLAGGLGLTGSADGVGAAARFNHPDKICVVGSDLYVTDTGNQTIRKIVIATGEVTTLVGAFGAAPYYADGVGTDARFQSPEGISSDGTHLYVADKENNAIRKIVIATREVSTLAGSADEGGYADGVGTSARFSVISDVASDGSSLYVVSRLDNNIRKIDIASGTTTTWTGAGATVGGATDGSLNVARFNAPEGITSFGTNLYVADTANNTIRKIVISTGEVTTLAGKAGVASGTMDGIGTASRFSSPKGMATDGVNLYVADYYNHTIRQIVLATAEVSTLAGTAGVPGTADGTGVSAQFSNPSGVALDGPNLYVTDYQNHAIRKIELKTRMVTTMAGLAGTSGMADGIGTTARFYWPARVVCDGKNLYVSDDGNMLIRKIVIATQEVSTLAGEPGVAGSRDGPAITSNFNYPQGLCLVGNWLYVVDEGNAAIRGIAL